MSRLKRFAGSLASGYVLLGANVLYTLASVPLALRYLSKPEFALWGLVSSIAQYVSLIDAGMSGASRILIDHKDDRDAGAYGSVIQTFFLVSLAQAFLILLIGIPLAFGLVPALHIPAEQHREFILLTIGQCGLLACVFVSRVLSYLLAAHQRYDVNNYSQAALFAATLAVLWLGFKNHQGVYSTLWAQLVSWVLSTAVWLIASIKLKLLPARHAWGKPAWSRFRELFNYGRDIFFCSLGFQMLNASQLAIITRELGLEVAAVWSVCTRTFIVVCQLIYRILDYSAPAMAEMIVRGEHHQLQRRFRSLVTVSVSLSVLAGTIFALCNQPFVRLWTSGKIGWSTINDVLLAISLVIVAAARCHIGLVGQTKEIRSMRFIYALEGAFFIGVSLMLVRSNGVTAILLVSIAGTLLFSLPYGAWRTSHYFNIPWRVVALSWMLPSLRLALLLLPIAILLQWLGRSLPASLRLLIYASTLAVIGVPLLLWLGLDENLRSELLQKFRRRFRSAPPAAGAKDFLLK